LIYSIKSRSISRSADQQISRSADQQISRSADQQIGSVTADGAYDTRRCHNAIADRGAPAVIPPRRNAQPWKPTAAGAVARNDALRASKYLCRAL
jgi:hypothetical protein